MTERSAMQMTAVYSCVRILVVAIAGLPLHVYRQDTGGSKMKALDHLLYRLFHDEPNTEMTSFVFRETRDCLVECVFGVFVCGVCLAGGHRR